MTRASSLSLLFLLQMVIQIWKPREILNLWAADNEVSENGVSRLYSNDINYN